MKMPTTSSRLGGAQRARALPVDVEQHVAALDQHRFDRRARRAVMIAEHHGVFEKLAAVGHLLELLRCSGICTRGRRLRLAARGRVVAETESDMLSSVFDQLARQRGFAGARRARQHEHQAAPRDVFIQHWRPAP